MKYLIFLLLFSLTIVSCGSNKEINSDNNIELSSDDVTDMQQIEELDSLSEENFICNIEVIHYEIQAASDEGDVEEDIHIIVSLRPLKGQLKNNWRIKTIQVEGKGYKKFDDYSLKSKGKIIYRNIVRNISPETNSRVAVIIKFENDRGQLLVFNIQDIQIYMIK